MITQKFINSIFIEKRKVSIGEPIIVNVLVEKEAENNVFISINGVPGNDQVLQFTNKGKKQLIITASKGDLVCEKRIEEIEVIKTDGQESKIFPVIGISQNFFQRNTVRLRLENKDDFKIDHTYFVWKIGETEFTSEEPFIDYCFDEDLDAHKAYTIFDITLQVRNNNQKRMFTGERTVSFWNSRFKDKQNGIIRALIHPETEIRREEGDFIGSFEIKNQELETLYFESVLIEFLTNDGSKQFYCSDSEKNEWSLEANGSLKKEIRIPAKDFPNDAFGFAAHFRGKTESELEVIADVYFEIRVNNQKNLSFNDPELISILDDVRKNKRLLDSEEITLEQLTEHVSSKYANKRSIHQESNESEIITEKIIQALEDNNNDTEIISRDIEGEECLPGYEDNAPEGYVSQLTDEWKWVLVPARILNARKGDVLLSPGGSGAIGGLLMRVNPSQVYSHSGIMIDNYYRLKHSTASEKLLEESAGKNGFDPDKLKYAWPGAIEQSIEAAYYGSNFDYEGKPYKIKAFNNETAYIENIGLVEPVVIKPDPVIEAKHPQVREILHRVAESAKKIHSHYRFYCYTNADAFYDDAYKAPEGWWASNSRPTVCSSMIWAAIRNLEDTSIMIEGKKTFTKESDLELTDEGAEVDHRTYDGLYYYREDERKIAGDFLYNYFYDLAYNEIGFLGSLLTDAPDDLANQMCNTFAFDWADKDENGKPSRNSDCWKNPGTGRAVSPDNIKEYWDSPKIEGDKIIGLYGYSEELAYRPARLEYRRVRRWVKIDGESVLKGSVLHKGNPVSGAIVRVAGLEQLTDLNGEFELTIPSGKYCVEADKLIDDWVMAEKEDISLAVNEEKSITLNLKEPNELFREVSVRGSMLIVDDEWGKDEIANRSIFLTNIQLGPQNEETDRSQTEKMGGEVRVEMRFRFDWQLDASVDVWYEAKLFEGRKEDTNDLEDTKTGTINVHKDKTVPLTLRLVNTEFAGGDTANINLQISNDRQP